MTTPRDAHPVQLDGVPAGEGVNPADAAERLDEDPNDISRNREERPEVDLGDDA